MVMPRRRICTPPGVGIVPCLDVTNEDRSSGDAVVSIEAHDQHGVTAYRVTCHWDRLGYWQAVEVDPHPPTDALARMLAETAVARLTATDELSWPMGGEL